MGVASELARAQPLSAPRIVIQRRVITPGPSSSISTFSPPSIRTK